MASGALITYLGVGPIGSRPATPDTFSGIPSLYYATDTDTLSVWDGSSWEDIVGASTNLTLITQSTTSRTLVPSDAGVNTLIRCTNAGMTTVTFDVAEGYSAGQVFNIRAVGAAGVPLVGTGVTISPAKGGTLILDQADTVSVVMITSSTA